MDSLSLQSRFLEEIKKRLPETTALADELCEILSVSRDSAYRRIRGETVLSLDEVKKLYDRYGTSLDLLLSESSQMVTFHRRVVDHSNYTLEKWLNSLLKNLEFLKSEAVHEMIFSAKDIPIFHYFRLPGLSSFKLFFWMKTLLSYSEYEHKKFSQKIVPKEMLTLAERVWHKYSTINSTEIWNEEAVYDTLKQIEFYWECNFFESNDEPTFLCDQLIALLGQVQDDAVNGKKSDQGIFKLYNNEILIADNTVFASRAGQRSVYVNQNTLNLLLTFQEPFCTQTEQYLQNLVKKSNLISTSGEKERQRFFNNMIERVRLFKTRFK